MAVKMTKAEKLEMQNKQMIAEWERKNAELQAKWAVEEAQKLVDMETAKNAPVTAKNFWVCTQANFKSCELPSNAKMVFESQESSYYIVDGDDGVYRVSNHFVKTTASCQWLLDGVEVESFEVFHTGYVKFAEMKRVFENRGLKDSLENVYKKLI